MSAKDLDCGLPFFYRIVMPGVLLAAAAIPLLSRYLELLGLHGVEAQAWLAAALAVLLGIILSALDDPIYQIYEGRVGWPHKLAEFLTANWRKRVENLVALPNEAKAKKDTATYDELWSKIREFPMDGEGEYTATRPTKLGNVLASYEDYPLRS